MVMNGLRSAEKFVPFGKTAVMQLACKGSLQLKAPMIVRCGQKLSSWFPKISVLRLVYYQKTKEYLCWIRSEGYGYSTYGDNVVVGWPNGRLSGAMEQSVTLEKMKIMYSGYNGDGKTRTWVYSNRRYTDRDLTMKAFGYQEGSTNIHYSWGQNWIHWSLMLYNPQWPNTSQMDLLFSPLYSRLLDLVATMESSSAFGFSSILVEWVETWEQGTKNVRWWTRLLVV